MWAKVSVIIVSVLLCSFGFLGFLIYFGPVVKFQFKYVQQAK